MLSFLKYQGLTIGWALFILVICNMPANDFPNEPGLFFPGFDKLAHTGLFFVQTVFILFGMMRKNQMAALSFLKVSAVVISMIAFGGLIEILQWKVFTSRSGEWADLFADAVGVCMAAFSVCITAYALRYEKNKPVIILFVLMLPLLFSGCGLFKKKCNCPHFTQAASR